MMKRLLLVGAALSALIGPAAAQRAVLQGGSVTANHPVMWWQNGIAGDAGSATSGLLSGVGVTNSGTQGICINSAVTTSPYNQICLGVTTNGNANISVQNYGGATAGGLVLSINGSEASFGTPNVVYVGSATLDTTNPTSYFSTYDQKGVARIEFTNTEDVSAYTTGSFRDSFYVSQLNQDDTDYGAVQHVAYGLRSFVSGPYDSSTGYGDFYQDGVGIDATAIARTKNANRGVSGITTTCVQLDIGICSNEFAAGQPADSSAQSASIAGIQAIISAKYAAADNTHFVWGLSVLNTGKTATSGLAIASAGTGGDTGYYKSAFNAGGGTVTEAGLIMPASATSADEGTIIQYSGASGGSWTDFQLSTTGAYRIIYHGSPIASISSSAISFAARIGLSSLAQIGSNTVLGNATGSSADIVTQSMPSCSTSSSALIWTTNTGFGCNTAIAPDTSLNNTWTGTNHFNGSTCFKNGYPWADITCWGVVSDGNASAPVQAANSTAIAQAIAALTAIGGGTLYVPPGYYCFSSTITIDAATITVQGAGQPVLAACGNDINTFNLNFGRSSIRDVFIVGKGNYGEGGTFGATYPALLVGTACSGCILDRLYIVGGSHAIQNESPEALYYRLFATGAYGSSNFYSGVASGVAGGWVRRGSFNQGRPSSTAPSGFLSWASATAYSVGDVAAVSGYFIQVVSISGGGISGSSAPTLANYGVDIIDNPGANQITWQLYRPVTFYLAQMDTGTTELYLDQTDMSGTARANFAMTNSLVGAAPSYFRCMQCIPSNADAAAVILEAGSTAFFSDSFIAGAPDVVDSIGIYGGAAYGGILTVTGGLLSGSTSAGVGIQLTGGSDYVVQGAKVSGAEIADIANTNAVNLANNKFTGTSGVTLSGTTDRANVHHNDFNAVSGTKVTNTASGTKNRIQDNPSYNPIGGSAISPGASPYTYTAGASPETVYITTGTVSDVSVGGVTACAASPCAVQLGPNEAAVVTYAVAPTMNKYVH